MTTEAKVIAYRYFGTVAMPPSYVSELPGEGGVDWGYSEDFGKARVLTFSQWKRFAKHMRDVGSVAFCFPPERDN